MKLDELEDMFTFHPPKDETVSQLHSEVRSVLLNAAVDVFTLVPNSHERDVAIAKIREAMFWSNAAVACNQMNRD